MDSWIYLFSQFSKEALLFQGLLISILCVLYSGFWILNKRRFGSVKDAVPSGVVKTYLNELIVDAERAKAQLFGMLGNEGLAPVQFQSQPMPQSHASAPAEGATAQIQVSSDPALAQTIAALEAKLAQQNQVISQFTTEKSTLVKEIEALKAAKAAAPAASGGNADQQARIKELEDRLNEYSVIEDDLANLKRLQQENARLKAALEGKGESVAAAVAAAPAAAASETPEVVMPALEAAPAAPAASTDDDSELLAAFAAATETASTPTAEAKSVSDADLLAAFAEAATPAASTPAPAPEAVEAAAPATSTNQKAVDNIFDNLVSQVEESLQPVAASVEPVATAAVATEADKPKSGEDDLISEFEKMLNS